MGQETLKMISSKDLLAETLILKNNGYRLVAISCTSLKNQQTDTSEVVGGMELTYSFDKDYDFINLRFITDTETKIESITVIYPYSFLYENEIKELFGVRIKQISISFHKALYTIPVKTPFKEQKEDN